MKLQQTDIVVARAIADEIFERALEDPFEAVAYAREAILRSARITSEEELRKIVPSPPEVDILRRLHAKRAAKSTRFEVSFHGKTLATFEGYLSALVGRRGIFDMIRSNQIASIPSEKLDHIDMLRIEEVLDSEEKRFKHSTAFANNTDWDER